MLKYQSIAFAFAAMCIHQAIEAAQPVYKCLSNGAVVYQSDPCLSNIRRKEPNINQLNAERMKKLLEDDNSTTTEKSASVEPPSAKPHDTSVSSNPGGKNQAWQTATSAAAPVLSFKCDGRKYCSQMTSCSEAKFFLNNCAAVKMDGDRDGIPCEAQWCKSLLH